MTESHNQPPSDDQLREMFERFQGPDSPSPQPRRIRRKRFGLSLAFAALLVGAATVVSVVVYENRHERPRPAMIRSTSASCIAKLKFEGRLYFGSGTDPNDSFQHGELLGTGILPSCGGTVVTELTENGSTIRTYTEDDIGDQSVNVFSIIGLKPIDVVMVEGQDDSVYYSESIGDRIDDSIHSGKCPDHGPLIRLFRCMGISPEG
jgi:hypothetical protein